MNFSRNLTVTILFGFGLLSAAELYARKMEIVRTMSGPVTVLRDSVTITDKGTVIHSRYAQLSRSQDQAVLSDSVRIQTPEVFVLADSVEYDFQQRQSWLYARPGKMVLVRQESVEIRAPVVAYDVNQGLVQAPQGLELKTRSQSFLLTGKDGVYFVNSRSGIVDSEPVLTIRNDQEAVVVTANKMEYAEYDSRFLAAGKVRVCSGAGELVCDSAVFFMNGDSGIAWGLPQVHDSSGTAKGDTLVFYLQERALRQVSLHGRTEGEYRTEAGETVLVTGSVLSMLLDKGKIEEITVDNLISGQLIRKWSQQNTTIKSERE
uniref:Organic solvent tolerance-like N-terminal domain-containing protein n=1 Tax=candidate division WOR-3 bacterium TaxID=2052148 RepID=A0A7V3PUZ2_UNCW3